MSDNGGLPRLVLIEDNPGDAVLVREMLRSSWPGDFAFDHFDRVAAAAVRPTIQPSPAHGSSIADVRDTYGRRYGESW